MSNHEIIINHIELDIVYSMTPEDEVTVLDPFTHTSRNREKILIFDFVQDNSMAKKEKVMIDETFCTLVTVEGKFIEKKVFGKVLKKIDEIRRIIRVLLKNHFIVK